MGFPRFRSPYIKIDCPDGPRFILRRPEKAFSIIAVDWDTRIKGVLKAFERVMANVELSLTKRFRAIVDNLRGNYAELQAHYQAAYLQFAGNPCDRKVYKTYMKANQEIRQNEMRLREVEMRTEKVLKLIKPKKREPEEKFVGFTFHLDVVSVIVNEIEKFISEFHH